MERDVSALEHEIVRNRSMHLSTAMRILGNHEDAEDAVQNAALKAFRAWERFRGEAEVSTWITRIVINESLMMMRQGYWKHEIATLDEPAVRKDSGDLTHAQLIVDPVESVLDRLERESLLATAKRAVRSDLLWETALLTMEGLRQKEIARVCGATRSAVRSRLHRVYARARRRLMDTNQGVTVHSEQGTALSRLADRPRVGSPEMIKQMVDLYDRSRGLGAYQIGKQLGVSAASVYANLKKGRRFSVSV